MNRILKGTDAAKEFLDKKQYRNLRFDYDTWDGQTHNSEVPLSLEKILKEKLFYRVANLRKVGNPVKQTAFIC